MKKFNFKFNVGQSEKIEGFDFKEYLLNYYDEHFNDETYHRIDFFLKEKQFYVFNTTALNDYRRKVAYYNTMPYNLFHFAKKEDEELLEEFYDNFERSFK